ncbi:MAG: radical SAM protein [Erysipelotrichaceae bacterium]
MKVLLTTLNAKYIHKNLALRWLYVARDKRHETVLKEFTINDKLEKIVDSIVEINPDLIGFSCYIWNGQQTLKVAKKVKEKLKDVNIVLGGPEVSYQYEDYLTDDINGILLGEGEISFWKYVNQENQINGLVTHSYVNTNSLKTDIAYLETLDSPYLLDFDMNDMDKRYLYVETSRGCPYKCKYCMASLDNDIREFSLDYLFDLFDKLEKTKVNQIKFLDRTFNANKNRSLRIARRLIDFKDDVSFQFEIMADTLSNELIDLVCANEVKSKFRFEAGIQSFNKETLKAVSRYQNTEKMVSNLNKLVKNNTIVHADLIAGLPKEDLDSFKNTYQRLFQLKVDEMQVGILKLLKGTALEDEMDKYGIIADKKAPYQIISSDIFLNADVKKVELVALATDRLWNRNICRHTLWYLFENTAVIFEYMLILGEKINSLKKPYQRHHLFKVVYESIGDETGRLILLNEYYYLFKQRPVRIVENSFDKKLKAQILEVTIKQGLLTQNDIRYAYFDYGIFKGQKCYQMLIYNSDQKYPDRYFISLNFTYLGKEDLNERCYDCYWQ